MSTNLSQNESSQGGSAETDAVPNLSTSTSAQSPKSSQQPSSSPRLELSGEPPTTSETGHLSRPQAANSPPAVPASAGIFATPSSEQFDPPERQAEPTNQSFAAATRDEGWWKEQYQRLIRFVHPY